MSRPRVDERRPRTNRGGSAFAALTSRDFRVFWVGVLVSRIGESMQMFAVGWLVVQLAVRDGELERAALYAGILGLARLVPALVVGVVAGAVVDRVDRRTTLFVEESAALVSSAALGILTISGAVSFGWVLVYGVVSTVTGTFERLTRQAILPGLTGADRLPSAVGLNGTATGLSLIFGPLLGGLLIGTLGVGGLLLLNVATYGVALVTLAWIPPQPIAEAGPRLGFLASIRRGLAFVRNTPFGGWQLFLLLAVTLLAGSLLMLLPAYVSSVLHTGAVQYSWLVAVAGVGSLVATVMAPKVGARYGRGRVFILASLGSALALVLLGMQRASLGALVLVAAFRFLWATAAVLCVMITQLTTPNALQGRAIGVQQLVVDAGSPAGAFLVGSAGSVVGVGAAMTSAGVILAATTLFVFVRGTPLRTIP